MMDSGDKGIKIIRNSLFLKIQSSVLLAKDHKYFCSINLWSNKPQSVCVEEDDPLFQ